MPIIRCKVQEKNFRTHCEGCNEMVWAGRCNDVISADGTATGVEGKDFYYCPDIVCMTCGEDIS